MKRLKKVLLLIESSREYGRGCLRGIAAYTRAHGGWHTIHLERALSENIPTHVSRLGADGIISRLDNDRTAKAVKSLGLPTVDLRGIYTLPRGALFDTDPQSTAQMAIDHLSERGFVHYAYCGFDGLAFSDQRAAAFEEGLKQRNTSPHKFQSRTPHKFKEGLGTSAYEIYGESHLDELAKWLAKLPKPLGLMACNDNRGRQVIMACDQAGIKVPEEVAVLGVDDDEVICELSRPPLSSIAPDTYKLGYEGAKVLDLMMREKYQPAKEIVLIPPLAVTTRLSTDILAFYDRDFKEAFRYLRENACEGIDVNDIVRVCNISRATLERRFLKYLGCSPKEQIMKVRLERAKLLLVESEYKINRIALLTGFRTTAHLVTRFREEFGTTPGKYRGTAKHRT